MSKFLLASSSTKNNTNGSQDILGSSLGATNLLANYPIKTNSSQELISKLLDVADVSGLQGTLDTLSSITTNDIDNTPNNVTTNGLISSTATINGRTVASDRTKLDLLHDTLDLQGLTASEVTQLKNIDATTISAGQWGYVGNMNQEVNTTANPTFNNLIVNDLTINGTSHNYTSATTKTILDNNDSSIVYSTGAEDILTLDTLNNQNISHQDLDVQGNITVTGTVDGVDIATRDSALTTLEGKVNQDLLTTSAVQFADVTVDQLNLNNSTITFTGADTTNEIKIPDNISDALSIKEGTNKYVTFDSSNGTEKVDILKNTNVTGDLTTTGNIIVTGTVDGVDIATRDSALTTLEGKVNQDLLTTSAVQFADVTVDQLNLNNSTITFTGANTTNEIKIPDNISDALSIKQGTNKYVTFDSSNGAEKVDILKNTNITGALTTTGNINSIDLSQLNADTNSLLNAISVSSDLLSPSLVDTKDQTGTHQQVSLDTANKLIFVAGGGGGIGAYSYDVAGVMTAQSELSLSGTGIKYIKLSLDKTKAFVSNGGGFIHLVDITTPSSMSLTTSLSARSYYGIDVDQNTGDIWVAVHTAGVGRYSSSLVEQNVYDAGLSNTRVVKWYNNRLYVGTVNEFYLLDITTPSTPALIHGAIAVDGDVRAIEKVGTKLYVLTSHSTNNFYLFDVSTEASPSQLDLKDVGAVPNDFRTLESGGTTYIYIAGGADGVHTYKEESNALVFGNTLATSATCNGIDIDSTNDLLITGIAGAGVESFTFAGILGANIIQVTSDTQSTSTTTGALQVAGGVGIVKDVYIGGRGYMTNAPVVDLEISTKKYVDDSIPAVPVQSASNLGGGTGLFSALNVTDLEFKGLTNTDTLIGITNNSTDVILGVNQGNIVQTGALDSGSITANFGNIDNGTSTITTDSITVNEIVMDNSTITLSGATGANKIVLPYNLTEGLKIENSVADTLLTVNTHPETLPSANLTLVADPTAEPGGGVAYPASLTLTNGNKRCNMALITGEQRCAFTNETFTYGNTVACHFQKITDDGGGRLRLMFVQDDPQLFHNSAQYYLTSIADNRSFGIFQNDGDVFAVGTGTTASVVTPTTGGNFTYCSIYVNNDLVSIFTDGVLVSSFLMSEQTATNLTGMVFRWGIADTNGSLSQHTWELVSNSTIIPNHGGVEISRLTSDIVTIPSTNLVLQTDNDNPYITFDSTAVEVQVGKPLILSDNPSSALESTTKQYTDDVPLYDYKFSRTDINPSTMTLSENDKKISYGPSTVESTCLIDGTFGADEYASLEIYHDKTGSPDLATSLIGICEVGAFSGYSGSIETTTVASKILVHYRTWASNSHIAYFINGTLDTDDGPLGTWVSTTARIRMEYEKRFLKFYRDGVLIQTTKDLESKTGVSLAGRTFQFFVHERNTTNSSWINTILGGKYQRNMVLDNGGFIKLFGSNQIQLGRNDANSLEIMEGSDTYMTMDTTSQQVVLGQTLELGANSVITTGQITGGQLTVDQVDINSGLITYSGATSNNQIVIPDNLGDAFSIQEGANKYMTFDTTNTTERIVLNKPLILSADPTQDLGAVTKQYVDDPIPTIVTISSSPTAMGPSLASTTVFNVDLSTGNIVLRFPIAGNTFVLDVNKIAILVNYSTNTTNTLQLDTDDGVTPTANGVLGVSAPFTMSEYSAVSVLFNVSLDTWVRLY